MKSIDTTCRRPRQGGLALTFATLIVAATLSPLQIAKAEVMLDPTAISTNMGTYSGDINNVINQAGQVPTYISGVTDYASYTSTATAIPATAPYLWTSAAGATTGNVDFTLGGTYTIDSFAMWGLVSTNTDAIGSFILYASSDPSFTSTTLLGSYTPSYIPGTPIQGLTFDFTPTSASYVRMQITGSLGGPDIGINEGAFAAVVPEPGNSGLILAIVLGALGLGFAKRAGARG